MEKISDIIKKLEHKKNNFKSAQKIDKKLESGKKNKNEKK